MIDIGRELGAQSYCFRGLKKNEQVAEALKACGLTAVEPCAVHVDFKNPASFDGVVKAYRDSGIRIASVGVVGFADDEKTERNYFEFAKKAGTRYIGCDFAVGKMPKCVETATKLADEYDMKLAIHNHGGRHWLGCSAMLSEVFAKSSPRIGLCLDTAWALDSGEDPVGMAEKFAGRLYGLHIKDFTFDRARKPKDMVSGTGNLDLGKLYQALKKMDFGGFVVIEYEGDVENPVPAVTQCVAAVRAQMKG